MQKLSFKLQRKVRTTFDVGHNFRVENMAVTFLLSNFFKCLALPLKLNSEI